MLSRSRVNWFLALLAVICLSSPVWAQQRPDNRRGDQGGPGGRGGGGFQFFGGGGGGALGLLAREDVQEELELLDDQKKQVADLREKSQQKQRDLFSSLRDGGGGGGGGGDRREEFQAAFRKFNEENQAEVDKILLPHQSKRLKQLEAQIAMRGRGVLGGLGGGDIAEKLAITEAQGEQLREKARELETELRKKTNELRKQAQDQLLASLTEEQRKQYKELIGEPFEFRDEGPGFGGFGFGGGGPGGPGGPGGGRRGERPQNNN
jgi:Spy/CpxP family protein refolding chaperone